MSRKILYCLFFVFNFLTYQIAGQNYFVSGKVTSSENSNIIDAEVFDYNGKKLSSTNKLGYFAFHTAKKKLDILIFSNEYKVCKKSIIISDSMFLNIYLERLSVQLNQVNISDRKESLFALERLKDIVGTAIYAGKKSEVILLSKSNASLAQNNARQIYSQVAGLNIYQNDDAGLQLNVGGRGLDPNRTSNFNTRQNGYDISADVLGYPESYYTPPAEALEKIEIIRGAAALQYGTQFGGLINFVMKRPSEKAGNRYLTRATAGSNGFLSNFNSIDGMHKGVSYYSFFNFKKGDGFRVNSNFESKNAYIHLLKNINKKISASFEFTLLSYIAKQAGGMNDQMFLENPLQSNRDRNWFKVNWLLYNLSLNYQKSENTLHTFSLFALDAERFALGYRSNRVAQADPLQERDLIHGQFNNLGFEYKTLLKHEIKNIKMASLLGFKVYKSKNKSQQGPGSKESDADFNFYSQDFPYYNSQSSYIYPNLNLAIFGENIFYINKKLSITPGFRHEYIDTKSDGQYSDMFFDNAGNPIFDTIVYSSTSNVRDFIIFGLGLSYKIKDKFESYANISQNYRSVTFSDISIINPAYIINPEIEDEKGYTSDIGFRGNIKNSISYDISCFYLRYNQRIGFIQKIQDDGNVKSERGNIGDAQISGIESFIDWRIDRIISSKIESNLFVNTAFIKSEYINSQENGIKGKTVEFVPEINLKAGFNIKYKHIKSNIQFTYLGKQFTDATNAIESNLGGVIGEIPQYQILDFGFSYNKDNFTIESGINNFLNKSYFTRRATGYPGPGIIPSPKRNYYVTFELNF